MLSLKNHIRRCHRDHAALAMTLGTTCNSSTIFKRMHMLQVSAFDSHIARELVVKYISVGVADLPLTIGEQPAHEEYVRNLCP